jgi:hypothetical protein
MTSAVNNSLMQEGKIKNKKTHIKMGVYWGKRTTNCTEKKNSI